MRELGEDGKQREKLRVRLVVEPGGDGDSVVGMERIGDRRVVYDDGCVHIPSQPAEILNVDAICQNTMLSEKAVTKNSVGVKEINNGVGILGKGSSKKDDFEYFSHVPKEFIHMGTLLHKHTMNVAFNFDWNDKICGRNRLKRAMNKGLVQIKHQAPFSRVSWFENRQQVIPWIWLERKSRCTSGPNGPCWRTFWKATGKY